MTAYKKNTFFERINCEFFISTLIFSKTVFNYNDDEFRSEAFKGCFITLFIFLILFFSIVEWKTVAVDAYYIYVYYSAKFSANEAVRICVHFFALHSSLQTTRRRHPPRSKVFGGEKREWARDIIVTSVINFSPKTVRRIFYAAARCMIKRSIPPAPCAPPPSVHPKHIFSIYIKTRHYNARPR